MPNMLLLGLALEALHPVTKPQSEVKLCMAQQTATCRPID